MVLLLSICVIRISNTGPQKPTFLTQHSYCQTLQKVLEQHKNILSLCLSMGRQDQVLLCIPDLKRACLGWISYGAVPLQTRQM